MLIDELVYAENGGTNKRGNGIYSAGYSAKAHCTGKPSYLEPNSQSMQQRGRGVGCSLPHRKTRTYLMPNRNSMQKPIGGRSKRLPAKKGEG